MWLKHAHFALPPPPPPPLPPPKKRILILFNVISAVRPVVII